MERDEGFWGAVRGFIDWMASWAGEWVVIPALFVAIIYFADRIVRSAATGSDHELSVRAGRYAGFVALVVFITSTNPALILEALPVADRFSLSYLVFFPLGAVWGSILVFALKRLIPSRLGGLIVAVLVFLGSASLYVYVVHHNTGFSQILRWWTLGQAFGILILASVSPRSIREFLPIDIRNPFEPKSPEDSDAGPAATTGGETEQRS